LVDQNQAPGPSICVLPAGFAVLWCVKDAQVFLQPQLFTLNTISLIQYQNYDNCRYRSIVIVYYRLLSIRVDYCRLFS